ncbi:MAG: CDP-alcohol phosphatidyltransferase family protein [Candidatus Thermoplasmatota archaeon]
MPDPPPSTPREMLKEAREERSVSPIKDYFDAALRDEWDGLDRINRDLRLADLFTIGNFLMGLGALLLATQGYVRLAVELVLIGVILDGVDGAVARMGKGGGPLGGVLDTLADALTFITTSAVVAFFALTDDFGASPDTPLAYAAILGPLGLYAVCGVLRLARFEALRDDGKKRYYFSGIPSPAAAVTLLSLVLVEVPAWVLLVSAVYVAFLMVSRIRFPKLRGWYAITSVAILLAVLATFKDADLQRSATWAMLAFMALYVIVGPFYVLAKYGAKFADHDKEATA